MASTLSRIYGAINADGYGSGVLAFTTNAREWNLDSDTAYLFTADEDVIFTFLDLSLGESSVNNSKGTVLWINQYLICQTTTTRRVLSYKGLSGTGTLYVCRLDSRLET